MDIIRKISIVNDIKCFYALYKFFKYEKFTIVHSVTPKAGILSMFASWLLGVPVRIHTFTGQTWVTKKNIKKYFLKTIDRCLALACTNIIVDSKSQLQFLKHEGVITNEKGICIGSGSISGVDLKKFKPNYEARLNLRNQHNIPIGSLVFIFLGRLVIEKGIIELLNAFRELVKKNSDIYLIIAGPDEGGLQEVVKTYLKELAKVIRFVPKVVDSSDFLAMSDVLVLPSYREGFGTVVIEAAAVGIPAIGTDIYGLRDSIEDGQTGILVPVKDEQKLEQAMQLLINNSPLRLRMSQKASERVSSLFSADSVSLGLLREYNRILGGL
jgi:glycosyltransferase involved in cell wall biosynthesis